MDVSVSSAVYIFTQTSQTCFRIPPTAVITVTARCCSAADHHSKFPSWSDRHKYRLMTTSTFKMSDHRDSWRLQEVAFFTPGRSTLSALNGLCPAGFLPAQTITEPTAVTAWTQSLITQIFWQTRGRYWTCAICFLDLFHDGRMLKDFFSC